MEIPKPFFQGLAQVRQMVNLKLVNNFISFLWKIHCINKCMSTDRWYHVCHLWNKLQLYIDGILSTASFLDTNRSRTPALWGYGSKCNPINYFNGWMDEFRIWKVELTVAQILTNDEPGKYKTPASKFVSLDVPGPATRWVLQMQPVNDG
jgi:hypothetical protein